jgi:hypothetical protein
LCTCRRPSHLLSSVQLVLWWWDNQEKEGSSIASFDAPQRTWWATLTGPAPPLTGKNCLISLCHFLLFSCSDAGLLYVHVTMTHGKRLSYPYSAVFADTVVPSRCHRTIIRWVHDGIARTSRSESILSHRLTAGGVSQAPAATSWAVAKSLACQKLPKTTYGYLTRYR